MKQIPLSKGFFALVDDEDYDSLAQWKWMSKQSRNTFYACRWISRNGKKIYLAMHRVILGVQNPKILVDHKDGNGLNNQKKNLRLCTNTQNVRNRKVNKGVFSGFKGVYKSKMRWQATIRFEKRSIYLGQFKTAIEAARAYNEAAKKYHGEFAKLNDV